MFKSLSAAVSQSQNPETRADAYFREGLTFREVGQYSQALSAFQTALSIRQQQGDQSAIADTYYQIGCCQYSQGRTDEALISHRNSLQLRQQLANGTRETSRDQNLKYSDSLEMMGNVYRRRGNYEIALQNYKAALEIRQQVRSYLTFPSAQKGLDLKIAETYYDAALTYELIGNKQRAYELHQNAFNLKRQYLSNNSVDLAKSEDALRTLRNSNQ